MTTNHKGNRGGSAPEYLRQAFQEYVRLYVQGQAPLVMTIEGQRVSARHVIGKLWHCTDILPDLRCDQLGIPHGSSYSWAAQQLAPIPNVCIDCEREISKQATRCRPCKGLAQWADEETKAKLLATVQSPEYRQRQSQTLTRVWSEDPDLREEKAEAMREQWQDEGYRLGRVEATKELWRDPDYRDKQRTLYESVEGRRVRSDIARAQWRDDDYRRRRSEEMEALWRDPEYRRRMSEAARKREARKRARREAEAQKASAEASSKRIEFSASQGGN